jgi:hypothetical protein
MAVVYSMSIAEELVALQCAYEGLSSLLDELGSDYVDRNCVQSVLDLLTSRFASVCERIEIEGFGAEVSKETVALESVEAG